MNDPRESKPNTNLFTDYYDLLDALRLLTEQTQQILFLLPKLTHSDNLFEIQYYMLKEVIPFMKSIKGIMDKWLKEVSV